MTTKRMYSPWIEWHGGECPVPRHTPVEVKFRTGNWSKRGLAGNCRWTHDGDDSDIIGYLVITELPNLEGAEKLLRANGYTVAPPAKSLTFDDVTPMKEVPPMGHPLRKLGVRLTELLDENQWAECERLLFEVWEHDAADRATGAQVIEENGRPVLTFWPYCTECKSPFQFDADEPFAYCFCGTTEWGDPRPASWVCPPRQPLNEKVEMNDKTEQTVTDELRLAAKSAEPYLTATIGASHLNKAADTIDTLRAQLAEAQRNALGSHDVREPTSIGCAVNRAVRDLPEGWEILIDLERGAGAVFLIDPDGNETMSEGGELFSDQINAAIDAAKETL